MRDAGAGRVNRPGSGSSVPIAGDDATAEALASADRLAYLAAVVDASSDAIVSKGLDGTITSWNASAHRIFGYTAEEMIGQNIRRLIPAELQAEEDHILAQLRAGRFIDHFETVRITKDGRRLHVSLSISPIRNSAGEIVGAAKIARDITARKEADELLAAATAKFESVFNQSGIFAGITDVEGNLREINDLALVECGYTRDEVLDRPFWSTPWWRGSAEVQARIRAGSAQAAGGEVFREKLPYWTADGTERIVDFAMHPIRDVLGEVRFLHPTGIDITDRTRAEEALRAREAEEREIALGLQRALLPDRLVVPARVSCAARYEAGSDTLEVGGDWYDAFTLEDGRVAVTVGDVVGHGLPAAAAMGQLRTAIAALAEDTVSPGELLARLDVFLARTRATDFATVFFGLLDPETGAFEYASAGHPPMLVVLGCGEVRRLDEAGSPPLCGEPGRARPAASTALEAGSLLVLYTDGLIERRGRLLEDGLERLAQAAAGAAAKPIGSVCDYLVAALGVDSTRSDDLAVLALRLEPDAAVFRRAFEARPPELRELRRAMRAWLAERDVAEPTADTLLLAVGEACSNAIEHAYVGREPGEVAVEIAAGPDGTFEASVRDDGTFRPPSEVGGRGHGTAIMRGLASAFSRESSSAGTTVRLRVPSERPSSSA
jgi:PAS domain S-box-containing protein